jgi:hypothetical protein
MNAMTRGKRKGFASTHADHQLVQERAGKWVANGTFGDPDRRMHPVDIAIETANNSGILDVRTSYGTAKEEE